MQGNPIGSQCLGCEAPNLFLIHKPNANFIVARRTIRVGTRPTSSLSNLEVPALVFDAALTLWIAQLHCESASACSHAVDGNPSAQGYVWVSNGNSGKLLRLWLLNPTASTVFIAPSGSTACSLPPHRAFGHLFAQTRTFWISQSYVFYQ